MSAFEFYYTVSSDDIREYMPDVPILLPASSFVQQSKRDGSYYLRKPNLPEQVRVRAADCGGFVASFKWGYRCGIMMVYEARPDVLVTQPTSRLLNLIRRFFAMSELYHVVQLPLPLFSSDNPQQKLCTRCDAPKPIDHFNFSNKANGTRVTWCRACRTEHRRLTYVKRPPLSERFWMKTDRSGECWLWTGARHYSGYGMVKWGGKNYTASRIAWELTYGEIPENMAVCHKCDNPVCVNPEHLFLGTRGDNNRDRAKKGRSFKPRGELGTGAKLTYEQVRCIRNKYANGDSKGKLAREYGVSPRTIKMIVEHISWKDETDV